MAYAFADVLYKNQDNIGGIPMVVYFAEHSDILTFPVLADFASVTTLPSNALLTGDFTMKTGKKFFKIELTEGKGSLTTKGVGEKGGRSVKPELKINIDGLTEEISGLNRLMQNGRFVFLIPNLNKKDNFEVIGHNPYMPAILKESELSTGEGTEGKRGASFTFEANDITQAFMDITAVELAALTVPAT